MSNPTDLVPHTGGNNSLDMQALETEMRYADLIANSDLVPKAYYGKPGNVLIAWGLGAAMGLERMESLYRIDVIQGKPAASAELIASNVRKAGHKLRTVVNEQEGWAETTIILRDDPDHPVTVRRDMAWAKRMGLDGKDNYRKQAPTMLQWRSISACARLACPDALYGVRYTPDELRDQIVEGKLAEAGIRPAASAAAFTAPDTTPADNGNSDEQQSGIEMMTDEQRTDLDALFGLVGITDNPGKGAFIADVLGRKATRANPMTSAEADTVIAALNDRINQ